MSKKQAKPQNSQLPPEAPLATSSGAVDPDAVTIVELFNSGKNSLVDGVRCHLEAG
jgi:hypothetical protein